MITKSPKTTRTQWKMRIFPYKSHEKSPFAHRNMHIPQELRIRSRGTERHSASN